AQEGLLDDVARVVGVAAKPVGLVIDRLVVTLDKAVQSALVPLAGTPNGVRVYRGPAAGRAPGPISHCRPPSAWYTLAGPEDKQNRSVCSAARAGRIRIDAEFQQAEVRFTSLLHAPRALEGIAKGTERLRFRVVDGNSAPEVVHRTGPVPQLHVTDTE